MRMSFTDHHIQDKIIFGLVNGRTRFSELVPEGMEHSLFMYHMKKLIKDGVVVKDDQEYHLSEEGAKLYNARYRLAKPLRQISVLIQFLVIKDEHVLLSRRTTSLQENLNEFMLPGGTHTFLSNSQSSARMIAKSRGLVCGDFICTVETISKQRSFHGLIDVYDAECIETTSLSSDHELVWRSVDDVKAMNFTIAGSAPFILQNFATRSEKTRLVNIVN